MNKPPKTIELNNLQYAQSSEFDTSWSTLERLVKQNKISRVVYDKVRYYEIDRTNAAIKLSRTVPAGYVKAAPYGVEKGFTVHHMRRLCATRGAPAVQRSVGTNRPAWYADKAWLDKKLGIEVVTVKNTPKVKTVNVSKTNKEMAEVQKSMYNLAVLIERADSLVTRLEAVLGTTKREPNTMNISITPANGKNGAH